MNQYLILFALIVLIGCNTPTSENIPTEQYDPIETYDTTEEPKAVDIDQTHGQLVLMPDNYYFNHRNIPDSVKLLFTKKVKPFDNTNTFSVFDSLETANDTMLPFYFYTAIIVSEQSDGSVAEMVSTTVHSFAFQHPKTLQKLLALPNILPHRTNRQVWLDWTLSEIWLENKDNVLVGITYFKELILANARDEETTLFAQQYVDDLLKAFSESKQTQNTP